MKHLNFTFNASPPKTTTTITHSNPKLTTTITHSNKALMFIGAIVHCITKHSQEFLANGLVGEIQTLNCNDFFFFNFLIVGGAFLQICRQISFKKISGHI